MHVFKCAHIDLSDWTNGQATFQGVNEDCAWLWILKETNLLWIPVYYVWLALNTKPVADSTWVPGLWQVLH